MNIKNVKIGKRYILNTDILVDGGVDNLGNKGDIVIVKNIDADYKYPIIVNLIDKEDDAESFQVTTSEIELLR